VVLKLILSQLRPPDHVPYYAICNEYVRVSKSFAEMLLHKSLSEFNLDILRDSKDIDKMWPVLIRKCPNLKSIACERYSSAPWKGKLIPARQLTHFKRLQTIIMPEFSCNDSEMKIIANSFPKLK
jgi:hypothetical protein